MVKFITLTLIEPENGTKQVSISVEAIQYMIFGTEKTKVVFGGGDNFVYVKETAEEMQIILTEK